MTVRKMAAPTPRVPKELVQLHKLAAQADGTRARVLIHPQFGVTTELIIPRRTPNAHASGKLYRLIKGLKGKRGWKYTRFKSGAERIDSMLPKDWQVGIVRSRSNHTIEMSLDVGALPQHARDAVDEFREEYKTLGATIDCPKLALRFLSARTKATALRALEKNRENQQRLRARARRRRGGRPVLNWFDLAEREQAEREGKTP